MTDTVIPLLQKDPLLLITKPLCCGSLGSWPWLACRTFEASTWILLPAHVTLWVTPFDDNAGNVWKLRPENMENTQWHSIVSSYNFTFETGSHVAHSDIKIYTEVKMVLNPSPSCCHLLCAVVTGTHYHSLFMWWQRSNPGARQAFSKWSHMPSSRSPKFKTCWFLSLTDKVLMGCGPQEWKTDYFS